MTATVPNISKGRINHYAARVAAADGTFVAMLLQDTGIQTLDALRDHDTYAAILAAANTECTVASYVRVVLTNTEVTAGPTVDDGANAQTFDTDDISFGALELGQSIQGAVLGYNPAGGSTDADIIPVLVERLAAAVALNGEIFRWRFSADGLWTAREPV